MIFKAFIHNETNNLFSVQIIVTVIDTCGSLPCENGGTCFGSLDGISYFCQCSQDFSGSNCQTSIPMGKSSLKVYSKNKYF